MLRFSKLNYFLFLGLKYVNLIPNTSNGLIKERTIILMKVNYMSIQLKTVCLLRWNFTLSLTFGDYQIN